jgi:hypothetical protein
VNAVLQLPGENIERPARLHKSSFLVTQRVLSAAFMLRSMASVHEANVSCGAALLAIDDECGRHRRDHVVFGN